MIPSEPKTIEGRWFIHGEEKPPVIGTLEVAENSLALTTRTLRDVSLVDAIKKTISGEQRTTAEVIHGLDEHGTPVTLFGCLDAGASFATNFEKREFSALAGISGLKVQSWYDERFSSATFGFDHLHRWFGLVPTQPLKFESAQPGFTLPPQIEFVHLLPDGTHITLLAYSTWRSNAEEQVISTGAQVSLRFGKATSIHEIAGYWSAWLFRLFGLLIGSKVTITSIRVFDPKGKAPSSQRADNGLLLGLGLRSAQKPQGRSRDTHHNMTASFPSIKDRLGHILNEWDRLTHEQPAVLELFAITCLDFSLHREAAFLFLVQAFEIYHSASPRFTSNELSKLELQERLRTIAEKLPSDIVPWASRKLKNNAKPLATKLAEIFEAHPSETERLLAKWPNAARRIAKTRNNLTHGAENGGAGDAPRFQPKELSRVSLAMVALLKVVLLRELGLGGGPVDSVVGEVEGYRFISLS